MTQAPIPCTLLEALGLWERLCPLRAGGNAEYDCAPWRGLLCNTVRVCLTLSATCSQSGFVEFVCRITSMTKGLHIAVSGVDGVKKNFDCAAGASPSAWTDFLLGFLKQSPNAENRAHACDSYHLHLWFMGRPVMPSAWARECPLAHTHKHTRNINGCNA